MSNIKSTKTSIQDALSLVETLILGGNKIVGIRVLNSTSYEVISNSGDEGLLLERLDD